MTTTLNERFVVCHVLTRELSAEASAAINIALVEELCATLSLGEPDVDVDEMGLIPCDEIGVLNSDITVNYFKRHVPPLVAIVYDQDICTQAYDVINDMVVTFEGIAQQTKVVTVNDIVYNCLFFSVNMRAVVNLLAELNRDMVCCVNDEYIEEVYGEEAG